MSGLIWSDTVCKSIEAPGDWGNSRIRPFISGEKGTKAKTEGNRGTKAILENREHRKLRL